MKLPPPKPGNRWSIESDDSLRTRIANKYGMWGAFLSVVMESSGDALDDCASFLELKRIVVEVPDVFERE